MRIRQVVYGGLIVALAGCEASNDGIGVGGTSPATVVISGVSGSYATGVTVQLTATALDASGARIGKPGTFTWTSSLPSVASVDATGNVSTRSAGTTSISAKVAGITGSTTLTVGDLVVSTKDTVVTVGTTAFSPGVVTIAAGGSVTFMLSGGVQHNVVFRAANPAGNPPDIQAATNSSFTRTFASQGTFFYDCTLHPGSGGRVVVQ
jgi:plastocyanin